MGVLSKISVGDIFYYQVDDIPTHTAPKGSVAIMGENTTYSNGFTYINNNGGNVWLKCIEPKCGEINLTSGTTTIEMIAGANWNAFNATDTWVLNPESHSDFSLSLQDTGTDDLLYTGSTTMRAICRQSSTIRGGTAKFGSFETGVSFNFTVPIQWNESFTTNASSTTNQQSQHILELNTNDYLLGAISTVSVESAGPAGDRERISKYCQITAEKLDEPLLTIASSTTIFSEGWESSGFTENGWTVVNDATNQWVVGQAESMSGTSSAYVSNDSGATASYALTVSDVSHFYVDIAFPSEWDEISLTFDWKCWGEDAAGATQYDYGAVVITDTGTTPTAASEVITTQATAGANGRVGATTNLGKFNEGYGGSDSNWRSEAIDLSSYSGSTKRLVFTWKDDTTQGDLPPFVVDNILITASDTVVEIY